MRLLSKKFRRSTLLSTFFIMILVGIALSRLGLKISSIQLLIILIGGVVFIRKKSVLSLLLITLSGILLGLWRGGSALDDIHKYDKLFGNKITLKVRSTEDAVYSDKSQLEFIADNVAVVDDSNKLTTHLPGKIRVRGFGEKAIYRYDEVEVSGKMNPALGSRQANLYFAKLKVLSSSNNWFEHVRHRFVSGMQSSLPEPQASFALGLLIGQRSTIPASLTLGMSRIGLSHVVAVSGYNLTIIVSWVRKFIGKRSKFQIISISFGLIGLFIWFSGLSPSIIRAGWVSCLSLTAWYYGRKFRPVLLIFAVAAGTAFFNPQFVWGDVSWYLSFLAFFGVLILAPMLSKRIFGNKPTPILYQLLLETLCAQALTMPIILFIFGDFSFISVLANLLIVPFVPLAMGLSLVAGVTSMIGLFVGWLALPARYILSFMIDVINLLNRVPNVFYSVHISWQVMSLFYGVILWFCLILWRYLDRRRPNNRLEY